MVALLLVLPRGAMMLDEKNIEGNRCARCGANLEVFTTGGLRCDKSLALGSPCGMLLCPKCGAPQGECPQGGGCQHSKVSAGVHLSRG